MALVFNSYLKGGSGIINAFKNSSTSTFNPASGHTISAINIFPSTVAFPGAAYNNNLYDVGAVLSFSVSQADFIISGNSLFLKTPGITAIASSSGTASWWTTKPTTPNTGYASMLCDSIGLPGTNNVLTLSSLNFTTGQAITLCSFNLLFA